MSNDNEVGGIAADRLRSFIERFERLQEEIEALKADQKEIMAEAKATGFDTKTIRQIIKLRKMTQEERDEQEALLDVYKAALGMLNGTPLGDAAVRKLTKKEPSAQRRSPDPDQTDVEDFTSKADAPEPGPSLDDARSMGEEAARAGKPVTDNPFPARDPRRAAWDEAWCRAAGSDGMDLPDAWKRKKKPAGNDGQGAKAA